MGVTPLLYESKEVCLSSKAAKDEDDDESTTRCAGVEENSFLVEPAGEADEEEGAAVVAREQRWERLLPAKECDERILDEKMRGNKECRIILVFVFVLFLSFCRLFVVGVDC